MALTERWTAPKLPGEVGAALNQSLQRLERVLGATPVRSADALATSATTLTDTDDVLLVDTTGGGVTVTLPEAKLYRGRRFTIKKMVAANTLTIDGAGAETIDGSATLAVTTQYTSYTLQAVRTALPDTHQWVIV